MITLPIKGDAGGVLIEVSDYENASASNVSDANWLSCEIEVRASSFRGRYKASLTTEDFTCFEKELEELLSGSKQEAAFFTDEGWLRLEVTTDALGKGRVAGEASDNSSPRVSLSFAFETDRTYLEQAKNSLREITRKFPVQT